METILLKKPEGIRTWVKLYRLYLEAFPAAERKPFSMILRMYRKGKTDIWCLERGGEFSGLAITINGPDLILLDYFAVEGKCRGKGVGSRSLAALQQLYADKGFFLEIESTLEDAPNREQRLRRKAFYLRCGLEELHTTAKLFGVNMELLGVRCRIDYEQYHAFYRDNYNQWAADHVEKC
jgi:GNAT superfamily N-acetyltransferase